LSPVLYPPVYTLRLELLEIEPPIWRRIQVPGSFTLADVHDVTQLVMGWEDSHMHLFEIGGARYGFGDNEFDDDEQDDSAVLLGDLGLRQGDCFRYLYDFGDDWEHLVTVEAVRRDSRPADVPRLLGGERACPPEDCGGVHGYQEVLEALADPAHEEHASLRAWLGRPWDPEAYDVAYHQRLLRRPPRKRKAPRRTAEAGGQPGPDMTSPHMARANEVLALMDPLRRRVPWLPDSVVGLAADLLQRFCLDQPDEFLAVRKPDLWLAAGVHAAFMLHPYMLLYPLKPLTLQELAELCGVSVASISKRSRQLRQGIKVTWQPGPRS
jgi:hypothetical protein